MIVQFPYNISTSLGTYCPIYWHSSILDMLSSTGGTFYRRELRIGTKTLNHC
jgi:hypothetical protein